MSDGRRHYRQSLGWLAAEFVVIVLGVLTAFAAEQWRQDQQDRKLEIGYLERLKANLEADTANFATGIRENELPRSRVNAFRDVIDGRSPFPDDYLDFLSDLNGGMSANFDRPRRDTYDELINQGDLGQIGSQQIREALAEYYGSIQAQMDFQIPEWEATSNRVEFILIERLPASAYQWVQGTAGVGGSVNIRPEVIEPARSEAMAVLSLVRADPEIRNLLFRISQVQQRMASVHGDWAIEATALIGTLDAELARLSGG